jgi:type IV pilus assembly protein PilN
VIKINLLAMDRDRAKRKATVQISAREVTSGCSLILAASALVVGWYCWSLQRNSADLDQQIVEAERETVRLRNVIQQVQQFEQRRAQLQQRVTLIEQLRKGQLAPVHLLDQVSRALPGTMWLLELRQSDTEVIIEGRCTSLDALSDFVSSLEVSNLFTRPVEIIDSQVLPAAGGASELIRFSVRARLLPAS